MVPSGVYFSFSQIWDFSKLQSHLSLQHHLPDDWVANTLTVSCVTHTAVAFSSVVRLIPVLVLPQSDSQSRCCDTSLLQSHSHSSSATV